MGIIKELEKEIGQLENISLGCSGELSSELNRVKELIQETLIILKSDDETVATYEFEIKLKIQLIEKELKNLRENLLNKIKPSYLQGNKFSKYLDNSFTLNLSVIPPIDNYNNSHFNSSDSTNNLLNQIVIQHLIRNGKFELAEKFSAESLTPYPEEFKAQFEDMYQILEAMKDRQLESALEWCLSHIGDVTVEEGESLIFKIHRLQYCYYLSQGKRLEALAYAKKRLAGFTGKYLQEIQKLLCSSLYQSNPQVDNSTLNTSPYSDLYKDSDWEDIQYYFVRYFCKVMGRSHEPPLYVTVTAGTTTLPKVVKAMNIMTMQNVSFDEKVELPIDLQLTDDMKYHSIFLCPINKEWATEENPPMLLPCGHAICKDSLNMLSKGGTRFKCTYCPNESLPSQAQILHF